MKKILISFYWISLLLFNKTISSQETRVQFPGLLRNSYFGVNVGYINYPFTNNHIKSNYSAEYVRVPHTAVKIILFGHEFNKNLSAQITYMRPVEWAYYHNVNGSNLNHTVWMNIAGLTLKSNSRIIKDKLSFYGEAGLGIVTRNGFKIDGTQVSEDANYGGLMLGGGLQFRVNKNWDLLIGGNWTPQNKKASQPQTIAFTAGFNHNLRPLSPEKIERISKANYLFPKRLLQLGYSTNSFGYGVNNFFADGAIPLFWGGTVSVQRGMTFHYQKNVFHVRKVFSLDWGASVGIWKTDKNEENFFTVSAFPVFRFTLLRTKPADFYFYYSVAGPTFISKAVLDNHVTGRRFTFQDLMGIGMFSGPNRKFNSEIRIGHYSNGNIFPDNKGIKIPLTFNAGFTF